MTVKRSRCLPFLLLTLIAYLSIAPAAQAATTAPFELQTSAAQTATGNGGGVAVAGISELLLFFDCTASSGTGETLDAFLQSTSDGGVTWFDLPFELGLVSDGDGAETLGEANARDFIDLGADAACSGVRAVAKYRNFGSQVRVKWFINGTTPSYTFSVKAIGKN